jgi:hypothetical protein
VAEEITPGFQEWRRLYESAVRIKEISPWEWMTETDIFGVRSPETGELGFVSVMGMLGEHYAVSLYLGSEGIHGFLNLQEMGPLADPEALIQIPSSRRRSRTARNWTSETARSAPVGSPG